MSNRHHFCAAAGSFRSSRILPTSSPVLQLPLLVGMAAVVLLLVVGSMSGSARAASPSRSHGDDPAPGEPPPPVAPAVADQQQHQQQEEDSSSFSSSVSSAASTDHTATDDEVVSLIRKYRRKTIIRTKSASLISNLDYGHPVVDIWIYMPQFHCLKYYFLLYNIDADKILYYIP